MFLKHKKSGDLVEISDVSSAIDPTKKNILARFHHGEELQDEESISKDQLQFPSGENLPLCWTDANYRSAK